MDVTRSDLWGTLCRPSDGKNCHHRGGDVSDVASLAVLGSSDFADIDTRAGRDLQAPSVLRGLFSCPPSRSHRRPFVYHPWTSLPRHPAVQAPPPPPRSQLHYCRPLPPPPRCRCQGRRRTRMPPRRCLLMHPRQRQRRCPPQTGLPPDKQRQKTKEQRRVGALPVTTEEGWQQARVCVPGCLALPCCLWPPASAPTPAATEWKTPPQTDWCPLGHCAQGEGGPGVKCIGRWCLGDGGRGAHERGGGGGGVRE